jgi:hypothetical protein
VHFPLHSFSFDLSFAYLLFCWKTSLNKNWKELIRRNIIFFGFKNNFFQRCRRRQKKFVSAAAGLASKRRHQ